MASGTCRRLSRGHQSSVNRESAGTMHVLAGVGEDTRDAAWARIVDQNERRSAGGVLLTSIVFVLSPAPHRGSRESPQPRAVRPLRVSKKFLLNPGNASESCADDSRRSWAGIKWEIPDHGVLGYRESKEVDNAASSLASLPIEWRRWQYRAQREAGVMGMNQTPVAASG